MSAFPECEKLAAVHDGRTAIIEFVEWAASYGYDVDSLNVDRLVLRFYGIDTVKLEAERRAMLDEARRCGGQG